MASIFSHRSTVPLSSNDYRRYRPYIREDFQRCCAFCLLPESFAGGEESFEIDHFRPKSKPEFAHLISEYTNLYYVCHVCNNTKRHHWPSSELQELGYRFVDTCEDDFSSHFQDKNGEWQPKSPAGMYTEERLRLNRQHLIDTRQRIRELLNLLGAPPINWDKPLTPQVIPITDL